MKLKLTTALLLLCQWLLAQNQTIEGKVTNKLTGETIPYANIYNKTLQKGTISNDDGYFRLEISGPKDSVLVSFLGYKSQYIPLSTSRRVYEVLLEESGLLLNEIVVTPKLSHYLYDRLSECRKQPSRVKKTAKAYYGLKTYRDDQQIELVESFYNLDLQGYDVAEMKLKLGRFALQPYADRFFVSMESSLAIAMLRLLDDNDQYPTSPLVLNKKQLK
ncbi:MAG: carboxypeptidase-like regulatory domain-containing protein, partial [Saprospiraceae bacterium]|nr:carboxypeptidase-like regulatory domain-containing protein [Saprospiraceae bacterium]